MNSDKVHPEPGQRVTIVIPTLNEAENLPVLIRSLEELLPKDKTRIIVVDDNSSDGTADVAEKLDGTYKNIYVHRRPGRLGIGSAVLDGFKIALTDPETDLFVTMDADLSHNPQELTSLLHQADGVDLVQGSRYIRGGSIVGWGFRRRLISGGINTTYRILFRTGLHDHTSFFRVHSRRCAEAMVSELHCDGYELGIAAILLCKEHKYSMKEVPTTFTDRERGSSKLRFRHIIKVFSYASKAFLYRSLRRVPWARKTSKRSPNLLSVHQTHPSMKMLAPSYLTRVQEVLNAVKKCEGKTLLNVGCGDGEYNHFLRDRFEKLVGIDIEKEYLKIAHNYNDTRNSVIVADASELPFPDNSFDIVICVDVLEHAENADKAISEMYRVLKKNGNIVITTPHQNFPFTADPVNFLLKRFNKKLHIGLYGFGHTKLYTLDSLKAKLEQTGFVVKYHVYLSHYFTGLFENYLSSFLKPLAQKSLKSNPNRRSSFLKYPITVSNFVIKVDKVLFGSSNRSWGILVHARK